MLQVSYSGPHQTESQRQSAEPSRDRAAEAAAREQIHRVRGVSQQEPFQRQPGRVRAPVHQKQQDRGHRQHRRGRGFWDLQLSEIFLQLPRFLVWESAGRAQTFAKANRRPAHQLPAQVSGPQ